MEVAVIGAGSWGTALAVALSKNENYRLTLWVRSPRIYKIIILKRCNDIYLPGIRLHRSVKPVTDLADAVRGKRIVILAVPSPALRRIIRELRPYLGAMTYVVNAARGLEPETNLMLSQVMEEELSGFKGSLAVVSGPANAWELARFMPSVMSLASNDLHAAQSLIESLSTGALRLFPSPDLTGVCYGGALANVIALGCGICQGIGAGESIRGAFFSRFCREAFTLGRLLGANEETLTGISGLGDFFTACTGVYSTNRAVGEKLGEGKRLSEITSEKNMAVEGITTLKSAYSLFRSFNIESPVTDVLYSFLFEGGNPRDIIDNIN